MNNNYENAVIPTAGFRLPDVSQNELTDEDLADDLAGIQPSFTRIKIPSGGSVIFEIPGDNPDDPEPKKEIEGVIIFSHLNYAYWPEGSEYDENTPPLCTSFDGKIGCGTPGGICDACGFNKYGTAVDNKGNQGRGKACKNMRNLYILRDGDIMPIVLSLPPTSLKSYNDFANAAFFSKNRTTYTGIVKIGLKRIDAANAYSVATFKKVRDFEGEELARITAYSKNFRSQIKGYLDTRISEALNNKPDGSMFADGDLVENESGERYVLTSNEAIYADGANIPL